MQQPQESLPKYSHLFTVRPSSASASCLYLNSAEATCHLLIPGFSPPWLTPQQAFPVHAKILSPLSGLLRDIFSSAPSSTPSSRDLPAVRKHDTRTRTTLYSLVLPHSKQQHEQPIMDDFAAPAAVTFTPSPRTSTAGLDVSLPGVQPTTVGCFWDHVKRSTGNSPPPHGQTVFPGPPANLEEEDKSDFFPVLVMDLPYPHQFGRLLGWWYSHLSTPFPDYTHLPPTATTRTEEEREEAETAADILTNDTFDLLELARDLQVSHVFWNTFVAWLLRQGPHCPLLLSPRFNATCVPGFVLATFLCKCGWSASDKVTLVMWWGRGWLQVEEGNADALLVLAQLKGLVDLYVDVSVIEFDCGARLQRLFPKTWDTLFAPLPIQN